MGFSGECVNGPQFPPYLTATEQAPGELGLCGLDSGTQEMGLWPLPDKAAVFRLMSRQRKTGCVGLRSLPLRTGLGVPVSHGQE